MIQTSFPESKYFTCAFVVFLLMTMTACVNKMVAQATIESKDDDAPLLQLPKGNYRPVALAGTADCKLPDTPSRTYYLRAAKSVRLILRTN